MDSIISKKNTEADFQVALTEYMQNQHYNMDELENSSSLSNNVFTVKNSFNKFFTRLNTPGAAGLALITAIITYSLMSV